VSGGEACEYQYEHERIPGTKHQRRNRADRAQKGDQHRSSENAMALINAIPQPPQQGAASLSPYLGQNINTIA
jgi:hypothetical protein